MARSSEPELNARSGGNPQQATTTMVAIATNKVRKAAAIHLEARSDERLVDLARVRNVGQTVADLRAAKQAEWNRTHAAVSEMGKPGSRSDAQEAPRSAQANAEPQHAAATPFAGSSSAQANAQQRLEVVLTSMLCLMLRCSLFLASYLSVMHHSARSIQRSQQSQTVPRKDATKEQQADAEARQRAKRGGTRGEEGVGNAPKPTKTEPGLSTRRISRKHATCVTNSGQSVA